MNRKLLATAICASIMLGATSAYAQDTGSSAQDQTTSAAAKKKKDEAKNLDAVVVTGSLIPQSAKETSSPVIKITAQDLQAEGYRNVYDALKSVSVSTGSTQDNQAASAGSFTPGATTISLFGLDPGFTLILLDGHPLADYPVPYNGVANVTDLSNIPTEMVDHIDILTGGASSLYGSSAIAGVVNIILKKHVDGVNLDIRGGGYHDGAGDNLRAEITGGKTWGKLDVTYALSIGDQQPIRFNNSFFPSRLSNPLGPPFVAGRDFLLFEPFTGQYDDPGQARCDLSNSLFGGTNAYQFRKHHGFYCGSMFDTSNATILNKDQSVNGYLNLTYPINDNTEAYANLLYGYTRQRLSGGPLFWSFQNPALKQSANGFAGDFWDNAVGDFRGIQREFAPEEMGGVNVEKINTKQYNVNLGVKGGLGSTSWDYDAYYNRSQINTNDSQIWPLTKPFNNYYLGAQQGTDPYGYGFPAFTPNLNRLYTPLTPAQFAAMTAAIISRSVSWEQNVHATLTNSNLFSVPGGNAGIALIAEAGNQSFDNPVDPRLIAGDFNNRTGTQGGGSRNRYAVGGEFRMPLGTKKLILDTSARFDSYGYNGQTDAKPTYKLGLEFRPVDSLLLRGNYATAFRAPDMNYIFQGDSGFYTSGNDYYLCRLQGFNQNNLSNCPQAAETIFSFYQGGHKLKDITAKTYSFGFVWSPTSNWDIQADYNNIKISNEVEVQSLDALLQLEANCRLGSSFGGQTFDINSPQCQQALALVHRFPANDPFVLAQNQLQNVSSFPVNIAKEHLDGIQASTNFHHDIGRFGDIKLTGSYYVELHHKQQLDPGDPEIDLLHNFNSYEFKTHTSGSVTWDIGHWSSTVYGILYGKSVNFAGTGVMGRWASFNASLQYDLGDKSFVSATVNNLGNRRPPTDPTVAGSNAVPPPYYNFYVYNGYGASYWLEYSKHF